MSITELQSIEQKQRILSSFVEMRSRWLRAIRLAEGDRRSQILGQTTLQPKTNNGSILTLVLSPRKRSRMNLASVLDQVCNKPQIINYFLASIQLRSKE